MEEQLDYPGTLESTGGLWYRRHLAAQKSAQLLASANMTWEVPGCSRSSPLSWTAPCPLLPIPWYIPTPPCTYPSINLTLSVTPSVTTSTGKAVFPFLVFFNPYCLLLIYFLLFSIQYLSFYQQYVKIFLDAMVTSNSTTGQTILS